MKFFTALAFSVFLTNFAQADNQLASDSAMTDLVTVGIAHCLIGDETSAELAGWQANAVAGNTLLEAGRAEFFSYTTNQTDTKWAAFSNPDYPDFFMIRTESSFSPMTSQGCSIIDSSGVILTDVDSITNVVGEAPWFAGKSGPFEMKLAWRDLSSFPDIFVEHGRYREDWKKATGTYFSVTEVKINSVDTGDKISDIPYLGEK